MENIIVYDEGDVSPVQLSSSQSSETTVAAEEILPLYLNKPDMDHSSVEGKFSWLLVSNQFCLPQILRTEPDGSIVRYVSVKMSEKSLLEKLLKSLPYEVITTPTVLARKITANERRLLFEINSGHCDAHFGKTEYFLDDLLVPSEDFCQFYTFLSLCQARLSSNSSNMSPENKRFGFLRINGSHDCPYVVVEGRKFFPLFYFEEVGTDVVSSVTISGWDWAYLKFCCKVQGVKDSLLRGSSCSCFSEEELKEKLPGGATFQEFWPEKDFLNKVISSKTSKLGSWTRLVLTEGRRYEGKLTPIKEFSVQPGSNSEPPYKAELASIETKKVKGVNSRPHAWQDMVVSLPHLVEQIFPGYSDLQIGNILAHLGVPLYRANNSQYDLIRGLGWLDKYEDLPLVRVEDLLAKMESVRARLGRDKAGTATADRRSKGT